jgi:hypothetical protein
MNKIIVVVVIIVTLLAAGIFYLQREKAIEYSDNICKSNICNFTIINSNNFYLYDSDVNTCICWRYGIYEKMQKLYWKEYLLNR